MKKKYEKSRVFGWGGMGTIKMKMKEENKTFSIRCIRIFMDIQIVINLIDHFGIYVITITVQLNGVYVCVLS